MSSNSPNEDSKIVANHFLLPKYSWETETQCDTHTEEIPTYSWEFDTVSPISIGDSSSTIVPDSQCLPNVSWETQSQCDKYPDKKSLLEDVQPSRLIETSDTYGGSTSNECKDNYYDYEFAQRPESPNLNIDVDAIKRDVCGGYLEGTPKNKKDQYNDDEFAQRPESPNLNIDVDAIEREFCKGYVDSPPKKKKGKKSFRF